MSRRAAWLLLAGLLIGAVGGLGAAPAGADDVASAQRRANAAAQALAKANTDLALIEDDIVKVQADQAATEAELATLRTVVQETVVRSYVHAGGADIPYLLGGDLNAEARANALARFVTMGSFDQIDRYRALNADLQSGAQLLEQRKAEQSSAVAQLTAKREAATKELARLQALLRKRQQAEAAQIEASRKTQRDILVCITNLRQLDGAKQQWRFLDGPAIQVCAVAAATVSQHEP